jgi:hypothetical protein
MKKEFAKKIGVTFGAAMSGICLAPALEADVVDLTGNLPGTLSSTRQHVNFIGGSSTDWAQWNDGIGKTVTGEGYLAGVRLETVSNTLSAGASFFSYLAFGTSLSGTFTFGFITVGGNVGWIQILYSPGSASPVQYLAAAFEDGGGSIHVGDRGGAIPEPASLGLLGLAGLAAGAGARRRRKVA